MTFERELFLEEGYESSKLTVGKGSHEDLFSILESEMNDMEIEFGALFEKIQATENPSYADKVGLLENLGYLLEAGTQGVYQEETLFNKKLKDMLIAIWNEEVAQEDVIVSTFDQVLAIIKPVGV